MATESGVFGDDINSTPIGKLTMPPMSMSSKNDPGAPGPVEPPVYSPTVDTGGRRVTFDEHDYVQEIPSRKSKTKKRSRQPAMPAFQPGYFPPPPRAKKAKKTKKIFALAAKYGHQVAVCVLVLIVLWYYPKIVTFPYTGNGTHMSTLGIVSSSIAAAVAYGIVESIID